MEKYNNKFTTYEEEKLNMSEIIKKEKEKQKPYLRSPKKGNPLTLIMKNTNKIIGKAKYQGVNYYLFDVEFIDSGDNKLLIHPGKHYLQMPKTCLLQYDNWLKKNKLINKKNIKIIINKMNNYWYDFKLIK